MVKTVDLIRSGIANFSSATRSACFLATSPRKPVDRINPSLATTTPTLGYSVHFKYSSTAIFIRSEFEYFLVNLRPQPFKRGSA